MSIWRIIFANLKYSRRQHLGTCLGLALASMVLVGSLTIGDSVRATLSHKAKERIGLITHLFLSTNGYFNADLADRIYNSGLLDSEVKIAPTIITRGTIASPDGKARASGITVLGIDNRFFNFTKDTRAVPDLTRSGFWASPDLASELKTAIGARLILRVEEPSLFSRDAPLSGERDARFISWNRPFLGEVPSTALGNFSIYAKMESSRTIFVPLSTLQNDLFINFSADQKKVNFANLLLVSTFKNSMEQVSHAMERCWTLDDAGLELKKLHAKEAWNLRSRGVFLSENIINTAKNIHPMARGELTYLVNAIRKPKGKDDLNSSIIPYSMVAGVELDENGFLGPEWQEDKIAVNEWTAKDLNLSLGNFVNLEYFVVGNRRELIEKNRRFKVGKIIPMPEKILKGEESDWTPRFPGLSDAENCGEWDTGIPIKHRIRPKDEEYWDDYRGSPKAFISLKAAQQMWGNRWGMHTGLRIDGHESAKNLQIQLTSKLTPANFGIKKYDLKKNAKHAISGPVDFSQLFLSFGFFVVLAGLTLSALIFGFSLEQRNRQVGLLLSLGYTYARVRLITWIEVVIVCMLGALIGLGWAWFFGNGVLWMLNGAWEGAVSKLNILYAPTMDSVIWGMLASFFVGLIPLFFITRKQINGRPVELLQDAEFLDTYGLRSKQSSWSMGTKWIEKILWSGLVFFLIACLFFELPPSPSFFGIGALSVFAGLLRLFRHQSYKTNIRSIRLSNLLINLDFRSGRKITIMGILAVGTFLVIGAGGFKQQLPTLSKNVQSSTGGFSYIIQTSIPLYDDLQSRSARDLFDLKPKFLDGVSIVPVRSQDGEDASCLNLFQSNLPPLYGVPLSQMSGRFNFIEGNWSILEEYNEESPLLAVVDHDTLMWSLKKKVGDRIAYLDDEGNEFEVELAGVIKGSFLQGGIFVSEESWQKKFPNNGGYKEFWMGGTKMSHMAMDHLKDRLFNYGVRFQSVLDRLNQFKLVQNTYLSIFQALGGLGVLLGTFGVFIIVLRNLWERRKEQAILGAVGFSLGQLKSIAWKENARIIFMGLFLGLGAGLLGLIPAINSGFEDLSLISVFGFGACLFLFSYLSLFIAVQVGLRQIPFDSLRYE